MRFRQRCPSHRPSFCAWRFDTWRCVQLRRLESRRTSPLGPAHQSVRADRVRWFDSRLFGNHVLLCVWNVSRYCREHQPRLYGMYRPGSFSQIDIEFGLTFAPGEAGW